MLGMGNLISRDPRAEFGVVLKYVVSESEPLGSISRNFSGNPSSAFHSWIVGMSK